MHIPVETVYTTYSVDGSPEHILNTLKRLSPLPVWFTTAVGG
jgi:hypothetical protein